MHTGFQKRIIIGGLARAGTTLFRSMLDASPEIICGPETAFFLQPLSVQQNRVARTAPRVNKALEIGEPLVRDAILESATSFQAFDRMMEAYSRAAGLRKSIWAEKSPFNCSSYHWLALEDPEAYFISLIRDGRDVLTSVVEGRSEYHVSIQRYVESLRFVYACTHPRHLIVRYEDMVSQPDQTLRRAFEFLDVAYSTQALDGYRTDAPTRDPSKTHHAKAREAVSTQWVGRWQQPEHAARMAEINVDPRVAEWLERSGYTGAAAPPIANRPHPVSG